MSKKSNKKISKKKPRSSSKKTVRSSTANKKVKKSATKSKPKKKAVKRKSISKKSVMLEHNESFVAARNTAHASDMHAKTTSPVRLTSVPVSAQPSVQSSSHKRKFSFPDALSQIRNTVHKPVEIIEPTLEKITPISTPKNKEKSPYVLDLKKARTFLPQHTKNLFELEQKTKSKAVQHVKPASVFHELFLSAPKPSEQKSVSQGLAKSVQQHFNPDKHINLAPVHNKFSLRGFFQALKEFATWEPAPKYAFREPQKARLLEKELQAIPVRSFSGAKQIPIKKVKSVKFSPAMNGFLSVENLKEAFSLRLLAREFAKIDVQRSAISFIVLVLIVTLPVVSLSLLDYARSAQHQVVGAASSGVRQLQDGQDHIKQFQFDQAAQDFKEAGQSFQAAGALLQNQYGTGAKVASYLPGIGKKVDTANDLLEIGTDLSRSASLISQGAEVFTNSDHFLASESTSTKLEFWFVRLQEAYPSLLRASAKLQTIDISALPDDVKTQIIELQEALPSFTQDLGTMNQLSDSLLTFIGHDVLQRYLVIFQNNAELRATGGFIGSMALVTLDRGAIRSVEIPGGGAYDYQGSLLTHYQSPRALQLIAPRWELQDANWFFDFPTSAQKIAHLYEDAGGPSVEGVIAINTFVLEDLLQIVGPVALPEYGVEITHDNFRETLQNYAEFDYDKEINKPKQLVADLAPAVLEKLSDLPSDKYPELAGILMQMLQKKDVLLYAQQNEIEQDFSDLRWTGEIAQTSGDYLAVVHSNIAGQKTDSVINDSYDLVINVTEDGKLVHTLTITRDHQGIVGTPLTGVRNVDYVRVYVPVGSQLLDASGFVQPPKDLFEAPEENWLQDDDLLTSQNTYRIDDKSQTEVYEESGKTVFANWIQVDPGKKAQVKFVYVTQQGLKRFEVPQRDHSWLDWFNTADETLPKELRHLNLYWQKQSGQWDPKLNLTINYPQSWQIYSKDITKAPEALGKWSSAMDIHADRAWNWIFF